jgi:hypothetical protein
MAAIRETRESENRKVPRKTRAGGRFRRTGLLIPVGIALHRASSNQEKRGIAAGAI